MLKNKISIILVSLISLLTSSCATDINSSSYTDATVGEAAFSYQGVIISARQVKVNHADSLEKNQAGMVGGALGGGLIGSQFGKGSGNVATTLGGALVGGIGGALLEKKLRTQNGMEYVVKLTNGQVLSTVQGLDSVFAVGQHVMVIVSQNGRSRIIPDHTGVQDVQQHIPVPAVKIHKRR